MTTPARPAINALVELSVPGGAGFASRVEDVTADRIHLAAPQPAQLPDAPGVGDQLTVRWPAGPRGRYALPVMIVGTDGTGVPVLVVRPLAAAQIEQHREFVRGGGGEALRLRRAGWAAGHAVDGHIVDVGERSVRGRFTHLDVTVGDEVVLQMSLGSTVLPVTGRIRQRIDQPYSQLVDIVAVYDVGEDLARLIRRYVMQQQLLARTRAAEG